MAPVTVIETKPAVGRGRADVDEAVGLPFWVSKPIRLVGEQRPAWESHHGGDWYHGERAGRLAFNVQHPLFPWQNDTLCKILATRDDGLWSHPDVMLCIPRQQGKTQIVVMRILYGLFVLGEKIVYTAQRWATVEDVYDRIIAIIESRPSLMERLKPIPLVPDGYSKKGDHGEVYTQNGGSLDMGPRTRALGRGQTVIDLAIFDEAYDIKDTATGSLTGAQQAANNPQTIFISTAVVESEHPNCATFSAMRYNGKRHAPDLYAAEWAAPRPVAPEGKDNTRALADARADPEMWRQAQPSHGVTVRARGVGQELRRARTPQLRALFDADYLGWGQWPPDDEAVEPVISNWGDLVDKNPVLVGQVVIAVERTRDRKWWAIGAARRTVDGRVHVEAGYWRQANIGEFGTYLLRIVEQWNPVAIVVDAKSKGATIASYMHDQGIEMVVTNTNQLALATGGFVDSAASGDICHTGQWILADDVEGATTRELPRGDFVWDDTDGGLAPLKAVTLAHWGVLEFAAEVKRAASPESGAEVGSGVVDLDSPADTLDVMDAAF